MSQKKKAAPLPDSLRKELRRTIAIYIYSDVVCKKESMKENDQIKLMETLFFGSGGPDAISYIDMFLNGGGVFEYMFEQHKNVGKLKLKQISLVIPTISSILLPRQRTFSPCDQ